MQNLPTEFFIDGYSYYINKWGGISQYKPEPIEYTESYINHYKGFDVSGTNKLNRIKQEFILKHADSFVDSVLDYGFGTGTFLDRWAISGKAFGFDVVDTFKAGEVSWEIVKDPFAVEVDCVTMWDVFEHLEDLSIVTKLKTKFLAISLPNCTPEKLEDLESWKHLKPNEHLHHFEIESLKACLAEFGYHMLAFDYGQDEIRKPAEDSFKPNILQALFKKVS